MTAKYFSRHRLDRWLAAAVVAGMFALQLYRYVTFRFTTYDLAVFDQVVWKMAHGHGATSTLTAWNTFADHLSPILVVFVPLYWAVSTPIWFFAAQALALGGATLLVRPLATAVGLDDKSRYATFLVVAFALQPSLWNAAFNAFHPTTMAVPVLMFGLIAAIRQRPRAMWLAFLVLVLLRDDLALAGAAMAVVGWRTADNSGRKQRIGLVTAGLAWTVIGGQIGSAMGASRHFVARYGYMGDSMTDAATHPVHTLAGVAQHLFVGHNLPFVVAMLLPLAFLPLLKPGWAGLALFVSLPSLLAVDPYLHSYSFHYGAPLAPFLILAAAGAVTTARDGVALRRPMQLLMPVAAAGFALFGPIQSGILESGVVKPADARAAIATVKPSDRVVAGDSLGSYVAQRDDLVPYPWPFVAEKPTFPLDPRVTSTAQKRQQTIDVVILPKAVVGTVRQRFLAAPEIRHHFAEEDFGTVVVFRRR